MSAQHFSFFFSDTPSNSILDIFLKSFIVFLVLLHYVHSCFVFNFPQMSFCSVNMQVQFWQ